MNIYAITTQEILDRISRHCPEALSVYLQCFNRVDQQGTIYFTKKMVEVEMSDNWRTFQNNIKKLARENLLEWHPFDNGLSVTMMEISEDE